LERTQSDPDGPLLTPCSWQPRGLCTGCRRHAAER
jgi:predicted Fe-S protein YdhL (DUF1289 family)